MHCPAAVKLASSVKLLLSDPFAQPDEPLCKQVDDDDGSCYAEDVASRLSLSLARVEETIDVFSFSLLGHVGEGEVESEDEDEPNEVKPGLGVRARNNDLEEAEEGVDSVF